MKIRLASKQVDLRNLPLDGFDMFLLTRLEGAVTVAQLLDIAPCSTDETMRRLRQLAHLKVIELEGDEFPSEDPKTTPRDTLVEARSLRSIEPDLDDVATLRPPRPSQQQTAIIEDVATLRPPKPLSISDMFRLPDPPSVSAVIARAQVGIDMRSSQELDLASALRELDSVTSQELDFRTTQERVLRDGRTVREPSGRSSRELLKTTMVDEDSEARAALLRR